MRRRLAAFTLIEVLAAVFLTAIVMTVAIGFFVNLSDSTDAAAAKARQGRHALAVVDRISRDLEGAYLLAKPAEVDPLSHPWVFLAESQELDSGADRLRFVTRNYRPRNPQGHGSDLATVTYMLHRADDAPGFELLRAVAPGLPLELDLEFPSADDERFMVVAENIDLFAMRFMGPDREWGDEWDSSQLEQSGELPLAAEIEIAFLPSATPGVETLEDFGDIDGEEKPVYTQHVRLPMKAVDLAQMLEAIDSEAAGQAAAAAADDQEAEDDQGEDGDDDELGNDDPDETPATGRGSGEVHQ